MTKRLSLLLLLAPLALRAQNPAPTPGAPQPSQTPSPRLAGSAAADEFCWNTTMSSPVEVATA